MRLICLNIWGGRLTAPLLSFIQRFQKTTQIFCFQEVFDSIEYSDGSVPDLYGKMLKQLSSFTGYLTEPYSSFEERLAIFLDSTFASQHGDIVTCNQLEMNADKESSLMSKGAKFTLGSRLQWVTVEAHDRTFTVANVHGIWSSEGKNDNALRIYQSSRIAQFLSAREGPKILCGDFNLLPDTRSLAILEESGMRNLIKEYDVTTTRSKHYLSGKGKFADYVFTTRDVRVRDFKVLQDEEVSDHLPLLLEFD